MSIPSGSSSSRTQETSIVFSVGHVPRQSPALKVAENRLESSISSIAPAAANRSCSWISVLFSSVWKFLLTHTFLGRFFARPAPTPPQESPSQALPVQPRNDQQVGEPLAAPSQSVLEGPSEAPLLPPSETLAVHPPLTLSPQAKRVIPAARARPMGIPARGARLPSIPEETEMGIHESDEKSSEPAFPLHTNPSTAPSVAPALSFLDGLNTSQSKMVFFPEQSKEANQQIHPFDKARIATFPIESTIPLIPLSMPHQIVVVENAFQLFCQIPGYLWRGPSRSFLDVVLDPQFILVGYKIDPLPRLINPLPGRRPTFGQVLDTTKHGQVLYLQTPFRDCGTPDLDRVTGHVNNGILYLEIPFS